MQLEKAPTTYIGQKYYYFHGNRAKSELPDIKQEKKSFLLYSRLQNDHVDTF